MKRSSRTTTVCLLLRTKTKSLEFPAKSACNHTFQLLRGGVSYPCAQLIVSMVQYTPPLTGKVNSGYKQLTVTHRSKMNTRNQSSDSSSAIHPLLNSSALLAAALFGRFCFRLDEGSVSGSGNNSGPCEVGVDLDASEDSGSP